MLDKYSILKNRPYQMEIINKILENLEDKKFILLDSPTGSGKTIIALVLSDILWKEYSESIHIAVRTSEQIKRYLEDCKKVGTIIKALPNKRKSCPIFINTNLSGEEIICKECPLKKHIYDFDGLWTKLEEFKYNFEIFTFEEHKKYIEEKKGKCIYHSFKKIDSNIIVTTYPYIFNDYLNEIVRLYGDPYLLILDESHNLLGSILVPFRTSFKKVLEEGFRKRKEQNELYKLLKTEIEILERELKIANEDIEYVLSAIKDISDSLLKILENNLFKVFKTEDKNVVLKKLKEIQTEIPEIIIEKEVLENIFKNYENQIELLLEWWDLFKEKMIKEKKELPKKKWKITTLLKLYNSLDLKDIVFVQQGYKLEVVLVNFKYIISKLTEYEKVLLMSGSNFTLEGFSKIFKVPIKDIGYIKPDISLGKKSYEIIWTYTSKYQIRKNKENVEKLIDIISFIINNLEKYQLFMFPSMSYMRFIYNTLPGNIKDRIFLDTGDIPLNYIMKTDKDVIFTYARSRFVEGVELVKDGKSLLKVISIVGVPYPPPPNASPLLRKILETNNIDYKDFSEMIKDIQIRQVIGRAIRDFDDEVKIFFIDYRYRKADIKKYL